MLALDADQAGVRSGLKSAHMALTAGFEVKVPSFPEGKDPADLARENPELLKAAVRTSKSAIEFFLDALRPGAKDSRAYTKIVEAAVLPLVAATQSAIEQEQHLRLIANRLGVSEQAVRVELHKRPMPVLEELSPQVHTVSVESGLSPLQKKVGMLLFGWEVGKERLGTLFSEQEIAGYERELQPHAEDLRFRFDAEVGEHTDEETVARDILGELEKQVHKERFKMKFL